MDRSVTDGPETFHPTGEKENHMQLESLKKCSDWFRIHSVKDLEDPSGQVARKEIVVSLEQYPFDFGLGPNPRQPVLTSPVSKKIGETLRDNWPNFHLLNRGVTIVAKSVDYDNKSQRIRLSLDETEEEQRFFGILDGGNTNARINAWREELVEEDAKVRLPTARTWISTAQTPTVVRTVSATVFGKICKRCGENLYSFPSLAARRMII